MKKKVIQILMFAILGLTLMGCKKILSSDDYAFYLYGPGDIVVKELEAIKVNDKRIKPFKDNLDRVEYLYFGEVVLTANQQFQIAKKDIETNEIVSRAQSEDGMIENLSPTLVTIPVFAPGTWNELMTVKSTGTYYVVYAEIRDGIRAFGLIKK